MKINEILNIAEQEYKKFQIKKLIKNLKILD